MNSLMLFILYFISLFALGLFGIHKYFLLLTFRKFKGQNIPQSSTPKKWPQVTVQLPIYNERYVVKRLLKAAVNLDYPLDKLYIQVLDDSTDGSDKMTARMVEMLRRKGFRIEHVLRPDRHGFKAGALTYGLERSNSDYIAIFDADFVPAPDFLLRTIPYIMQPGIGMVQTRWGHINRHYSLLTRLQAIFLDAHFIIEHLARSRSGRFFNFNGTAGVWRRQTILDAGGWQHDTLTEDLDLSYRAQLAGWKFIYLPDVVTPAELPAEMNAYKDQQHRWAKGAIQTSLKLVPKIWGSDYPLRVRLEAIIHLTNNFAYLLMAIPALLMVPIVKIQIDMQNFHWNLVFIYFLIFFSATLSVIIYYSVAIKQSTGKLWPHILYLPLLMALGIGLSLNNGRAALEALFGHKSEFKRTPKFRLEGRSGSWRRKLYKPGRSFQHFFELLVASYFTFGSLYFISHDIYYSMPFFLLFQIGFYYTGLSSMLNHVIWR